MVEQIKNTKTVSQSAKIDNRIEYKIKKYKIIKKSQEDNLMKKFFNPKLLTILNSLAVVLVASSANSACSWMFHQPEFPKEANRFKR